MSGQSTGNRGGPPGNPRSFGSAKANRRPEPKTEARVLGGTNTNHSGLNYNQNNSNSNQNNSNVPGVQNYASLAATSKLNAFAVEFVPQSFYQPQPPPPPHQSFSYHERGDPMYNLSVSAPAFVPREMPGYSMPQEIPLVDQFAGMNLVETGEHPMVTEFRQALDVLLSQQSPVIDGYFQQVFSNIEGSITDGESFFQIVDCLYNQCVYFPNFYFVGAKVLQCFCPPNVSNPLFFSFLSAFMSRYDMDFERRSELVADPSRPQLLSGLAFFLGELFVCLKTDGNSDMETMKTLPTKLIQMMLTLLSNPNEFTIKTAAQLCKLVGGHLQDSVQGDPGVQRQFEELFDIFRALLNTSSLNEICTLLIKSLLKAKEDNWGRNDYYPPSGTQAAPSYSLAGPEGVYYQPDGTPMGFGPGEEYELDEDEQLEYQRWQEERDEPPFGGDQASGYIPWSDSLEPNFGSYDSDRYDLVLDAEAEAAYDQFIQEQQQQLQGQNSRGARH